MHGLQPPTSYKLFRQALYFSKAHDNCLSKTVLCPVHCSYVFVPINFCLWRVSPTTPAPVPL